MKKYTNITKEGRIILENVRVAGSFFSRLSGLMMKKSLGGDGGLLLVPCRQIHTFMMRFPIDAVFLSREQEIVHIERGLVPGRMTPYVKDAWSVLEAPAGFAAESRLSVGDRLRFEGRGNPDKR
ncbi:MAG: DUF192 domain-containing protein [Clostridiales bacterium]|nr:DUF192 domain-containing protein [Clostridiales bacterium]HOA84894.1 DUF192 domain-containing protein [Bacillota bacterium]